MRPDREAEYQYRHDDFAVRATRAVVKSAKTMSRLLPIVVGAILLISIFNSLIPKSFYIQFFRKNVLFDSIIGSLIGSILAGSPLTSYVLGGEFLKNGVSISAVTAFLVAWVTVGMVQLPVEVMILGRRFAVVRNLTAFVFAIAVGIITMLILHFV